MAPDVSTPVTSRPTRRTSSSNPSAVLHEISPSNSRRTSTMGPPPLPSQPSLPSSPRSSQAATIPPTMERQPSEQGPIRHPRPLTAAELHLELEKEQESIVNRLTRELSALRAQTASVASTTSSTSELFSTTSQTLPDPYSNLPSSSSYGGVSIIPTSARRHRSSSNLSNRSARSARDAIARDNTTSVSSVAAPREADRSHGTSGRQSLDVNRDSTSLRPEGSRQNSYSMSHSYSQNYPYSHGLATNTSGGSIGQGITMYRSPSQTMSSYGSGNTGSSPAQVHRTSSASHHHSRNPSTSLPIPASQSQSGLESSGRSPSTSFGSAQAAARYEEAAIQRTELENVRRENEALRQRVRELERLVSAVGVRAGSQGVQMNGQSHGSEAEQPIGT